MAEDRIYLTVDDKRYMKGCTDLVAVISRGHPRCGDKRCTVLSVKRVKSEEEAETWYAQMKVERPWETRQ